MNPRPLALIFLLLGSVPGAAAAADSLLPDSTVIIRVGPKVIRADEFARLYWGAWPEDRPGTDSLGRAHFMSRLVDKEVLGDVARKSGKPLTFEPRVELRQYTDQVLSSALFQRLVLDSVAVTDAEMAQAKRRARVLHRFREIDFADRKTADGVRSDLERKRLGWSDAWKQHGRKGAAGEGDLGWHRWRPDAVTDQVPYDLAVGGTAVRPDSGAWRLVQKTEEKPDPVMISDLVLRRMVRQAETEARTSQVVDGMRRKIHITYDSTNVAWAAALYAAATPQSDGGAVTIDQSHVEIEPRDTDRILARWDGGGVLTMEEFVRGYQAMTPVLRRPIDTPERFRSAVDAVVIEPYYTKKAQEMGLERDPWVTRLVEKREEGVRFDVLYKDSVSSRVAFITTADRRAWYADHTSDYITQPKVLFAAIAAKGRPEADSLAARLRAGVKAEAILREDSLAGRRRGSIREMGQGDEGVAWRKLLFEEMRPGQVHITEPDAKGAIAVLQLIAFDPGRQLTVEEADADLEDAVRAYREEVLFKALIGRHKKNYAIETHPERIMRIKFEEPS